MTEMRKPSYPLACDRLAAELFVRDILAVYAKHGLCLNDEGWMEHDEPYIDKYDPAKKRVEYEMMMTDFLTEDEKVT